MVVGEDIIRRRVAEEDLKEEADKLLAKAIVAKTVEMEVAIAARLKAQS